LLKIKGFLHIVRWPLPSRWKHLAQMACHRRVICAIGPKTKNPKPGGLGPDNKYF
jgi:hypothetical protein